MNQQPLVSVTIVTYNREKYIKRAIESVLNQTYNNIEIIIIDGSPNDNTEKIIHPYLVDSRIHYVHQPDIHTNTLRDRENIIKARNKAVKISKGECIAILDDDDYWCDKHKLEKQIRFLEEHPDYVLVGGGLIRIDKSWKEIHRCLMPNTDQEIRKVILFNSPFLQSAVVFKKDIYEAVGGYDERSGSEGWDLMLRLGREGKMYNFQDYFTCYLENKRDRAFLRRFYKVQIKMRKKYRNDYPGYLKANFLGRLNYYYGFVPESVKKLLSPVMSKMRKAIFGSFGYKYKINS